MHGFLANFIRRPLISSRYVDDTQRPLHALVFLLPLLVAHEVGTTIWAQIGPADYQPRVGAIVLMQWFIRLFGETTSFLPALCLVAILLAWHIASGDKWTIHVKTLAGMLGESIAFAIPLLVFHSILLAATTQARETRLLADLMLSIGGGIYEELLFRLILFGLLTLLLIDCLGLPKDGSIVAIVLITSGAFAAYHHLPPSVEPFQPVSFFFRTAAGVYLAGLFLFRGFGIAAGCHAAYNVAAVLIDAMHTG